LAAIDMMIKFDSTTRVFISTRMKQQ
jgi:hypothetical protein